eukprot:sb/3479382/
MFQIQDPDLKFVPPTGQPMDTPPHQPISEEDITKHNSVLKELSKEQREAIALLLQQQQMEATRKLQQKEVKPEQTKTALAKRPTTFEIDEMEIERYIQRFEDYLIPSRAYSDDEKIRAFASYLPDKVNSRLEQDERIKHRLVDWETFKDKVKKCVHAMEKETGLQARTKLRERKQQRTESLRDYADDLVKLSKKAWPKEEETDTRKTMLKDALAFGARRDEVTIYILQNADLMTFQELIEKADILDTSYRAMLEMKARGEEEVTVLRTSGWEGANNQRPVQQYRNLYQQAPRNNYYSGRGTNGGNQRGRNGNGGRRRRTIVCWNCDVPGHIATECYFNQERTNVDERRYDNNNSQFSNQPLTNSRLGYVPYSDRNGQDSRNASQPHYIPANNNPSSSSELPKN